MTVRVKYLHLFKFYAAYTLCKRVVCIRLKCYLFDLKLTNECNLNMTPRSWRYVACLLMTSQINKQLECFPKSLHVSFDIQNNPNQANNIQYSAIPPVWQYHGAAMDNVIIICVDAHRDTTLTIRERFYMSGTFSHHPSVGHTLIKVLTPPHVAPPDASLPGADTGFSVGGGANIQICWIFPKTAWN